MEGFNLGSIVAHIRADTAQFTAAMDEAKMKGGGFGSVMSGVGDVMKVAAVGIGIAAGAAAVFGTISVKAYSESEERLTQLNAVIKSTGGVAGWTAQNAIDLSKALQKVTKYSDEDVLSVENLLLTFTAIGKDIMPQATETVLNMATALGEDTKSASVQLGKALQDPILGITALRRVGVNFSDAQKDVIKNLVDTGQKAEAQALILKELQTEFGGSAKAAGDTFSGSLAKLKNSLNDVEESLGKVIVTRLTPFISKAASALAAIDWEATINRTVKSLENLYQSVIRLYQSVFNYLAPGVERFIFVLQELWHWVDEMLMPSFKALATTLETKLFPQLLKIWNTIEPAFTDALKVLAVVVGVTVVAAMWLFINTMNVAANVTGFVIHWVELAIGWFGNLAGVVINVFRGIPNVIMSAFNGAGNWLYDVGKSIINGLIRGIKDAVGGVGGAIKSVGNDIGSGVSSALHAIHVPGFASGVQNFAGGLAMVGERGPELVQLPQGSNVIPNAQLQGMSNISTTINGDINIASNVDAEGFLKRLTSNQELAIKGITPIR
jgi:hypothetical protein